MNSASGRYGTYDGDAADPLRFSYGLPWWARRYASLTDKEKLALAKAARNSVIFGYDLWLQRELSPQ